VGVSARTPLLHALAQQQPIPPQRDGSIRETWRRRRLGAIESRYGGQASASAARIVTSLPAIDMTIPFSQAPTFKDLARAAQVNDIVTRSISGHLTERMQQHYSSVNAGEQRDAFAKVVRLFDPASKKSGPAPSGAG